MEGFSHYMLKVAHGVMNGITSCHNATPAVVTLTCRRVLRTECYDSCAPNCKLESESPKNQFLLTERTEQNSRSVTQGVQVTGGRGDERDPGPAASARLPLWDGVDCVPRPLAVITVYATVTVFFSAGIRVVR